LLGSLKMLWIVLYRAFRFRQMIRNFREVPRLEKGWKTLTYSFGFAIYFCQKNMAQRILVKCWWNWQLLSALTTHYKSWLCAGNSCVLSVVAKRLPGNHHRVLLRRLTCLPTYCPALGFVQVLSCPPTERCLPPISTSSRLRNLMVKRWDYVISDEFSILLFFWNNF